MKHFKNMKWLTSLLILTMALNSCHDDEHIFTNLQQEVPFMVQETLALAIAENMSIDSNSITLLAKGTSSKVKSQIKELLPVKDENNNIVFYIINYDSDGFLILSADSRIAPILAYSNSNEFRTDADTYPSGLVGWLSQVKEKVKAVRQNNEKQSKAVQMAWNKLMEENETDVTLLKTEDPLDPINTCEDEFEQVDPLLTTTWNQTCSYNDYMPILDCTAGCYYNQRAYAGCVPIAIAQVMKFYNHPISYNWSDMANSFGTTTTAAFIKDIHDAITVNFQGVEVSAINYDCDGTGVSTDYDTASIFTDHFGYSSAIRSNYDHETVKQQLRWNRPVILSGGKDEGWWIFHNYAHGHMWVCDGFRRNKICMFDDYGNLIGSIGYLYFHMNWGWGGDENGWYAFNNFNPGDSSYNYEVKMIYNINP
ncbi:C10 family peptidase [Aestuariivivens sediminis]|uniref:C10 family peptidase n=1 Tax=Aestuariivivens sediminis TaxID=2913557 RepID=UPI001F58BB7D|nr:C10 family peptidase [Aestuariivivens sediminis]